MNKVIKQYKWVHRHMEYYSKSSFLKSQNHSLKSYYISLLYFRCYKSCNIYDIVTKYSNFLRKKIGVRGIPRNLHSKIFLGGMGSKNVILSSTSQWSQKCPTKEMRRVKTLDSSTVGISILFNVQIPFGFILYQF